MQNHVGLRPLYIRSRKMAKEPTRGGQSTTSARAYHLRSRIIHRSIARAWRSRGECFRTVITFWVELSPPTLTTNRYSHFTTTQRKRPRESRSISVVAFWPALFTDSRQPFKLVIGPTITVVLSSLICLFC